MFCEECSSLNRATCRQCQGPANPDTIPACAACGKGPVLPGKLAPDKLTQRIVTGTAALVKRRKFWGKRGLADAFDMKPSTQGAPKAPKKRRRS